MSRARQPSNAEIPVVILAAGKGTRMSADGISLPKPLLPVLDYPLVSWQVAHFYRAGFRQFHVVASIEYDELLEDAAALGIWIAQRIYGASKHGSARITLHEQRRQPGIVGAMLSAGRFDTPIVVVLGDIWFVPHMKKLRSISRLLHKSGADVLAVARQEESRAAIRENFYIVPMPDGMGIKRVKEKPKRVVSNIKGVGIYVFSPWAVDVASDGKVSDLTDLIATVIKRGKLALYSLAVLDDVNVNTAKMLYLANMRALEHSGKECCFVSDGAYVSSEIELDSSIVMNEAYITGNGVLRRCVVLPEVEFELKSGIMERRLITKWKVLDFDD